MMMNKFCSEGYDLHACILLDLLSADLHTADYTLQYKYLELHLNPNVDHRSSLSYSMGLNAARSNCEDC